MQRQSKANIIATTYFLTLTVTYLYMGLAELVVLNGPVSGTIRLIDYNVKIFGNTARLYTLDAITVKYSIIVALLVALTVTSILSKSRACIAYESLMILYPIIPMTTYSIRVDLIRAIHELNITSQIHIGAGYLLAGSTQVKFTTAYYLLTVMSNVAVVILIIVIGTLLALTVNCTSDGE